MTALYLLDPAPAPAWAPFHGVRPIAELRAGAWRIRERWERLVGVPAAAVLSDELAGWCELDEPPVRPCAAVTGPAVVARSDFAPAGRAIRSLLDRHPTGRLVHAGETVGWLVPPGGTWHGPNDDGDEINIEGLRLRGTFDLVAALEQLLEEDCAGLLAAPRDPAPTDALVLGDSAQVAVRGATVEPGVVFDVRHGAIVLEEGVEVRHGTRIEGPLYAGRGTRLLGGYIRGSAFGPRCNVRGEVAATVFLGYANKSHDGFVGHSVLGHWVNLGAGTTTSNLKNTYGHVRLAVGGEPVVTGRQNLGSLIGDHAKSAIGTMLATGTVVSAGAHLFGATPPPKFVPPFAWGNEGAERLTEEGFLRIAERVMPRRDVAFTGERRAALAAVYRRMAAP